MIKLVPMTQESFDRYMVTALPAYAGEKMKAEDLSQEDAEKLAQDSFDRLLPQKLNTPGVFTYDVVETQNGQVIGALWYSRQGKSDKAFIYDIVVKPEHQGKGYGKATMLLAEEDAKKNGFKSIGLHVFGSNHRARALYEKLSYEITGLVMKKTL